MKILVTGGAGFIGTNLISLLLRKGYEVVCMDDLSTSRASNFAEFLKSDKFRFWQHSVLTPFSLECDWVFHLACPASPLHYQRNPVRTIQTAYQGTLNALNCAWESSARMLITSTSEVYGDPLVHPQKEDYAGNVNPIGPRSSYDEGKRAAESLATSWKNQFSQDVRIVRLFNTYGPFMAADDGRLVPNFILQAMRKEPLTVYGEGKQTRSLCYVSDMVEALLKTMELDRSVVPEVMNLGNPKEMTVLQIAQHIAACYENRSRILFCPLPVDDPQRRCPDTSLANRVLGWEPLIDFEEGIHRTIRWFGVHRNV